MDFDFNRAFEYENGFYATASVARFSKFVAHLDFFRQTSELRGEIVECGVFKGASLSRFAKFRSLLENTTSRRIVAFDTFGAFPDAEAEDSAHRAAFVEQAGDQSIGVDELTAQLSRLGLYENIEMIAGDLCETAPRYCEERAELRVSLLHIDVDLYAPTKAALEAFYPRLVPDGICILDDYGAFPGANRAIEEFFGEHGTTIKRQPFAATIGYVQKFAATE